ncbi:short internode related sequence [Trifolium pratense]|uniref:Short internode related sequence n=2 Tax=Trifolium pratense TaxID=57577 RepID=A0A2K3NT32_TRIPR|nr:protein SHI RELATED SEQUENCE 1-like [Trifolium pratense]PNY06183.1 short internode related sequence [Trifolium pratense]CAJ2646475.1 unnamed protein product [Trifolium pratense]
MAGLFSLGRSEEQNQQNNNNNNPVTEFWYNNNKNNQDSVSAYRGGFEIWNEQPPQHQQQFFPPQQDLYAAASAGVVLGVGSSRVCSSDENRSAVFVASGSGGGGISCQDCGNQAKKDCPHIRCRTCCKSRGFDCQTHVKSTWVPAARRRERQQQQPQQQPHGDGERDLNNSSLACTRLPINPSLTVSATGLLDEVNFPAVVSTPAEFRCVRVCSVDESEEEYAYSTAVNIGGHVFRGILYDYGPDHGSSSYNMPAGNASSSRGGGVPVQPLELISGVPAGVGVGAIVDPSSLYPAPLNTFMPPSGTQFFPHPRSS